MGRRARVVKIAAVLVGLCAGASAARADTPPIPSQLPDAYAVMVFENRSGHQSMEWMRAAIPFSVGEKLESHKGLRSTFGPMVLPDQPPPKVVDATSVAALGEATGASLVFTGWVKRATNWDLVVGVKVWRVADGKAVSIHEVTDSGEFKTVHDMINKALVILCDKAGAPIDKADVPLVSRAPTGDYYAFTLFGRGLYEMHHVSGTPSLAAAEKNLRKAVFIDPKFAEGHRILAVLYRWRGKLAKARGQFSYALDLRPDYFAAMAGQARVLVEVGEPAAARDAFEDMIQRRPWDIEMRFELGRLYWEVGNPAAARIELRRVVAVAPEHIPARRVLVLVYAALGEGADLIEQLEHIAKQAPEDLEVQLDLGAAYASVGRDKAAIQTYKAIVKAHPRHLQALKFLGDLHRKTGDLGGAIRYYRRALAANSRDPRPYFLLGRAYVDAGDDKSAKKIYLRAQKFKEYLPETYNNLGSIAYREEHFGQARWYMKRAVRKKPDNARFRYNYALVLSVLRMIDEALVEIEVGLQLRPDHIGLNYLRGVVLLRTGKADGAKAAFERVLELDPNHADAKHNLAMLEQMHRRAVDGEIITELPQPAD